jgi:hypothetical protein
MKRIEKIMLDALENAESILDYCQGDKWERECTESDRTKFSRQMDIIRKALKLGEYSPEGIEEKNKREAHERAAKHLEEEYKYWLSSRHKCPYCEKRSSREGLFQHMRDCHGINLNDGGKKWRTRAKIKLAELGV